MGRHFKTDDDQTSSVSSTSNGAHFNTSTTSSTQTSTSTSTSSNAYTYFSDDYPRVSYAEGSVYQQGDNRPTEPKKKKHTVRNVIIVILIILVIVVALVGYAGYTLYASAVTVKDEAENLVSEISSLESYLSEGEVDDLPQMAASISESVDTIEAEINTDIWQLAAQLPVIGQDVQSVQTLISVADDLVDQALVPLADSLSDLSLPSLFQDGSIKVDLITELCDSVTSVIPIIQSSIETIEALPEFNISQLQTIMDSVVEPLQEIEALLEEVEPILNILPNFFGSDGETRTYLIIAQNNSELRATGGLPGSWGTITISDGVISMGEFTSILHLDGLEVEVSDEELLAVATNLNTDPAQVNCIADFTRVGEMAREYWIQVGYGEVDGVIAVDPVFLQSLLAVTGGFTTSDGTVVDGTNAAELLLSEVYWTYGDDADAQDAYFIEVAGLAFESIMSNLGDANTDDLLAAIEEGAEEGRLLVWMYDEDEEDLMIELGFGGEIDDDPTTPVLGVYLSDDTYSKISWYASVQTEIGEGVVNEDGTTTYSVTTTITNTLTEEIAEDAPTYVTGYNSLKRSTSDMLDFVYLYAPAGGSISNVTVSEGGLLDGYGISDYMMNGIEVITMRTHVEGGESITITYDVTVSAEATETLTLRTTPLAQESLM